MSETEMWFDEERAELDAVYSALNREPFLDGERFEKVERIGDGMFTLTFEQESDERHFGRIYGEALLDAGFAVVGVHGHLNESVDDDRVSHLSIKRVSDEDMYVS